MATHKVITAFLAGEPQGLAWPGQMTYNAALPLLSVQLCWGMSPPLFRSEGKAPTTNFPLFSSPILGRPRFSKGCLGKPNVGDEPLPSCIFQVCSPAAESALRNCDSSLSGQGHNSMHIFLIIFMNLFTEFCANAGVFLGSCHDEG